MPPPVVTIGVSADDEQPPAIRQRTESNKIAVFALFASVGTKFWAIAAFL